MKYLRQTLVALGGYINICKFINSGRFLKWPNFVWKSKKTVLNGIGDKHYNMIKTKLKSFTLKSRNTDGRCGRVNETLSSILQIFEMIFFCFEECTEKNQQQRFFFFYFCSFYFVKHLNILCQYKECECFISNRITWVKM